MSQRHAWAFWESQFEGFLIQTTTAGDAAYDLEHIHRVVANAVALASAEQADLAISSLLPGCMTVSISQKTHRFGHVPQPLLARRQ